jgi:hypothetical protein
VSDPYALVAAEGRRTIAAHHLSAPYLPDPDVLLPLAAAAALPRLGGLVDEEALRRAARRKHRKLTTTKLARGLATTRAWIDLWIEDCTRWDADRNLPDFGSAASPRRAGGSSSTISEASGSSTTPRQAAQTLRELRQALPNTSTPRPGIVTRKHRR